MTMTKLREWIGLESLINAETESTLKWGHREKTGSDF